MVDTNSYITYIMSRSSSVDDGATCSIPGLELETARPDSGKRSFAREEPLQGENVLVLDLLFVVDNPFPCK